MHIACVCVCVTDWYTVIIKIQFIVFVLIDKLPSTALKSVAKVPLFVTYNCLPWTKICAVDLG